ncbi:MAG: hypothetical protein ACK2U0_22125 [Candidatus Promineifilaceae bacterium]|jgi:hypothetical protein
MIGKRFALISLLLITALFMVGTVSAQTAGEVTATVLGPQSPYTANVGDPLELTLVVTHPAGYHVIAPELGEQWGDFFIRSQSPAETATNGDGTETTLIKLDARLFAPGEFSTPPLTVTVTDGAGRLQEVTAEPAAITITSVLVEGDTELRDIKPQVELPFLNLIPWIAGGLLLTLLAAGGYYLWRRRQARLALAAVDNRLPYEIALDELDRIAQMGLPEQGRFKEHYTLGSDTIRLYLERTLGIPMMERTTSEIAQEMQGSVIDRGTRRRVVTFLEESDLVKFTDILPGEAEAYEILAQGRMIVEATADITDNVDNADVGGPGATFSSNGHGEKMEVSA